MRRIRHGDDEGALEYMARAARLALRSTCSRSRCGSLIVQDDEIIGRGFNSPPHDLESQRRCSCEKSSCHPKVTDKTCCVHAEQRAIMDALRNNPGKLPGSRIYFVRIRADGAPSPSGEPYCTICSKMALDVGITEFALWDEKSIRVYDAGEYNGLSYRFDT